MVKLNEELLYSRAHLIKDEDLGNFTILCLDRLPEYFWMKPSSSTGKYHPRDEHLPGGLALHTARAFDVGERLHNSMLPNCNPDIIRVSLLLHDCARYGVGSKPSEHSLNNHAELGADWVAKMAKEIGLDTKLPSVIPPIVQCIRSHMGRWSSPVPEGNDALIVHLADAVAAGYIPVVGEKLT
jgi:23S rRNA maturation-related 3'-5' exoribonuclease YhaM